MTSIVSFTEVKAKEHRRKQASIIKKEGVSNFVLARNPWLRNNILEDFVDKNKCDPSKHVPIRVMGHIPAGCCFVQVASNYLQMHNVLCDQALFSECRKQGVFKKKSLIASTWFSKVNGAPALYTEEPNYEEIPF